MGAEIWERETCVLCFLPPMPLWYFGYLKSMSIQTLKHPAVIKLHFLLFIKFFTTLTAQNLFAFWKISNWFKNWKISWQSSSFRTLYEWFIYDITFNLFQFIKDKPLIRACHRRPERKFSFHPMHPRIMHHHQGALLTQRLTRAAAD